MHDNRKRRKVKAGLAITTAGIFAIIAVFLITGGRGQHAPPEYTPVYAPVLPRVAFEPPRHTNIPPEEQTANVAPVWPQEGAYKAEGEETQPDDPAPAHFYPTERDLDILAQTIWGEARGTSIDEQRLVVWTVLQRIDDPRWPDTIETVIAQPWQFVGWQERHPICEYMRLLAYAEVIAWAQGAAPLTVYPFAPTAPYFFFDGDGRHNWFREVWRP